MTRIVTKQTAGIAVAIPAVCFLLFMILIDGLLCKVHVVIDMILAEAVIPLAAGTVTELQIWIIRVGSATDRALFGIGPVAGLPIDAVPLPPEIGGRLALASAVQAGVLHEILPAEEHKVQHSDNR